MTSTRLTAFVHGRVQGVGFRWWTRSQALALGLSGHASNLSDGRVEVVAEGDEGLVAKLLELLEEQPSTSGRPGRVDTVVTLYSDPRGEAGFETR
ncbi:acylphosphatase [Corynebacterium lubricantis]|uniref:acylphosphatase n=1 Tax=Corynebacterium lubricantis TaxID=541095 RepID=UPI00035D51BF|nr:acylphosphatase [Corynebacterium lubricantis]